jgi:hypothetical protein
MKWFGEPFQATNARAQARAGYEDIGPDLVNGRENTGQHDMKSKKE